MIRQIYILKIIILKVIILVSCRGINIDFYWNMKWTRKYQDENKSIIFIPLIPKIKSIFVLMSYLISIALCYSFTLSILFSSFCTYSSLSIRDVVLFPCEAQRIFLCNIELNWIVRSIVRYRTIVRFICWMEHCSVDRKFLRT